MSMPLEKHIKAIEIEFKDDQGIDDIFFNGKWEILTKASRRNDKHFTLPFYPPSVGYCRQLQRNRTHRFGLANQSGIL
jgi:hypothetical protein